MISQIFYLLFFYFQGTVQEEAEIVSDSATSNTTTPTNLDLEAAANNPPIWPIPVVPTIIEAAAINNPPVWPTPVVPTILEAVAEEESPQEAENEVVIDEETTSAGSAELEKNLNTEETRETTTTASTVS